MIRDWPGQLVLLGSGETSASGRRVFDWLFQQIPPPVRLAILETPAGFQPNSTLVARKVAEFIQQRLANYVVETTIVPARKRDTPFTPDDPALADQLLAADCLFLGPGSPTYAVRQLRESIVWDALRARYASGASLVLASAAVLAISAYTLPVYEIYKAGADLGWERGLDLLGDTGSTLVFVPHWNNREGGAELDTSHCFVGPERFAELRADLPPEATVVGIDEHTAFILDPAAGHGLVMGTGGVTIDQETGPAYFGHGSSIPLSDLGDLDWQGLARGLPAALVERARALAQRRQRDERPIATVPDDILALVQRRETARQQRDWKAADGLRLVVERRGYLVQDTPTGPRVQPVPPRSATSRP